MSDATPIHEDMRKGLAKLEVTVAAYAAQVQAALANQQATNAHLQRMAEVQEQRVRELERWRAARDADAAARDESMHRRLEHIEAAQQAQSNAVTRIDTMLARWTGIGVGGCLLIVAAFEVWRAVSR